jgi:hypothetical protein
MQLAVYFPKREVIGRLPKIAPHPMASMACMVFPEHRGNSKMVRITGSFAKRQQ